MPTILQVDSISKQFGPVRAVDGIRFDVEQGEIYGLLGPNGAGKTTTISMISGLLKPDQGKVVVDGHDFWSDPQRAQRFMGVVPQEVALYAELTGMENLTFWGRLAGMPKDAARKRAVELLEFVSLSERGREVVNHYSGGMKRRINMACALMNEPKLLLLDEPTVGIDPQARANILELVRHLAAQGAAVLYTTHYLDEAETLCHRVGIIDHGKILAEGTLAELQQRLGGDQLFVMEGRLEEAIPEHWPGFLDHFRVIQKTNTQLVIGSRTEKHPSDCLRELLELPVTLENVTLKRPSLNDVFLQLTGRELRE